MGREGRGDTHPGQEVVLGGQFDGVEEGAEPRVMVQQQETEQMKRPAISLTVSGRDRKLT